MLFSKNLIFSANKNVHLRQAVANCMPLLPSPGLNIITCRSISEKLRHHARIQ